MLPRRRCSVKSCSLQKSFEQPNSSRVHPVLLVSKGLSPFDLDLNPAEARWPPAALSHIHIVKEVREGGQARPGEGAEEAGPCGTLQ